tara:strand:- start:11626 stop:12537 length:912 start_codon:yes stop_codon:yes gene_type:complete
MSNIDKFLDTIKDNIAQAKEDGADKSLISKMENELKDTQKIKETIKEVPTAQEKKLISKAKKNVKDAKKLRRKVKVLKKQAGEPAPPNMNKVKKAQPRPPNNNPQGLRCFIRYNNQGRPYRICDEGNEKTKAKKPPSQITPHISPQQFLQDIDKTYIELTENQRNEYHRLDMAKRRAEERLDDDVQKLYQEGIKAKRRVRKEQVALNKLKEREDKIEQRIKEKDFKAYLKTLNYKPKGLALKEERKKFGLKEKTQKDKLKSIQKDIAEQQQEIQDNKDDLKQAQDNYAKVFKTTKKSMTLTFD